MDAISAKKLSMWKAMQTLIESEKTVDILMGNIALVLEDTHAPAAHEELALAAMTLVKGASAFPHCKPKLLAAGALKHMTMATEVGSPAVQKMARDVILVLTDSAPASSAAAGARTGGVAEAHASSHASKRELRGVQLNMDGLLGRRAEEDQYIKALLMVDGVTSVTLDRKREIALVYTHVSEDMKPRLYDVVQVVSNTIQDAAGLPRKSVAAGDHAAYLEDEDDAEDFFGGAKGVLQPAQKHAPTGRTEKSATARFNDRSASTPAPAGGVLSSFASWLGF